MAVYPARLPHTVSELIDDLDKVTPRPAVEGPITDDETLQKLVFDAGRRSIVDELMRLKNRTQKESIHGSA